MENAFKNNLKTRNLKDKVFRYVFLGCVIFCLIFLVILLLGIIKEGIRWISFDFLTKFPSLRKPEKSGIYPAIMGSLWIILTVAVLTVPIGVGSAIYLEEYANKKSKLFNFLEINISNLAGVPAIVYGLLGLSLFSRIHDAEYASFGIFSSFTIAPHTVQ